MTHRTTPTLFPNACLALLAMTVTAAAGAQEADDDARRVEQQQSAQPQQALEESQSIEERARQQQMRLRESQLKLVGRERELASRQGELERARGELERSRREMEAAAREIARLSVAQVAPTNEAYRRAFRSTRASGYIGATINDKDNGARVVAVTPGSPAAISGIMSGDVIVAVNGVDVAAGERGPSAAVMTALGQVDSGAIASIDVLRDGQTQTIEVQTSENAPFLWFGGARNGQDGFDFSSLRELPNLANLPGFFATRWRDMELVELTEGLGSYFGTDEGLLVVHAPANDDIGLVDGDVILEIGGRRPNSPEHAMRILTSFAPGETLELRIMRRQRRETLEYAIPTPVQ